MIKFKVTGDFKGIEKSLKNLNELSKPGVKTPSQIQQNPFLKAIAKNAKLPPGAKIEIKKK